MPENSTKILNKKVKALNRHWKNYRDKDYIGSHNLEAGEEMLLTISKFEGEEKVKTADGEKVAQVLYFKEDVPKMIMNVTNGNTISSLYGSHPDQWIGKQIQIYVASNVKSFGKNQDALRIRDFIPQRTLDPRFVLELEKSTDLDSLKTIWSSFPESVRNDQEMIAKKDVLKNKLL